MIALFVCNKELFEFLNAEATEQLDTLQFLALLYV